MFWIKSTIPHFELAKPNPEEIFNLNKPDHCSASPWVIEKVKFLCQQFGFPNKEGRFNFEPTTEIYELLKSGETVNLQEVVNRICNHIYFEPIPKFLYDWDLDLDINDATIGQALYADGSTIKVRLDFTWRFRELGAIVAHEITHHYLTSSGVQLMDKDENEKVVDLCSLYLGLGKIIMNGYDVRYDEEIKKPSVSPMQVGYLKLDTLAYAFDLCCCLAIVDPHTWTLNLSPEARYYVQSRAENRMQMYQDYWRTKCRYDKALERYKRELYWTFCHFFKMFNELNIQWQYFNQKLESINQVAHNLRIVPKHGKIFVQMNNDRINLELKINKIKRFFMELNHVRSEFENPKLSRDALVIIEGKLREIYPYLEDSGILRTYCSVLKKY
jgi:hypothetical protein